MCKQTRTKDHTICDIELGNNPAVLYNKTNEIEKAKGNLQVSADRNFPKAKDGLRKLESQRSTTNWYDWWFNTEIFSENETKKTNSEKKEKTNSEKKEKTNSEKKEKTNSEKKEKTKVIRNKDKVKVISRIGIGIFLLGFIIFSVIEIGIIYYYTINEPHLTQNTNLTQVQNIIFVILLLLAILLSPQLKSFSIGKDTASVQLDTDPPSLKKPSLEEPSIEIIKPEMPPLDYPIQPFIAPYYQDPFLIMQSTKARAKIITNRL